MREVYLANKIVKAGIRRIIGLFSSKPIWDARTKIIGGFLEMLYDVYEESEASAFAFLKVVAEAYGWKLIKAKRRKRRTTSK